MRAEIELPDYVVRFFETYAEGRHQSAAESMKFVLVDFAQGVIEDGFPIRTPASEAGH